MGRKLRGAVMVVTALAAAGSVLWMQGRYEAADQRHALEIVQSYHPEGGTDIPALLASRHPDRPVDWSSAVESSCFQHIRVHAVVNGNAAEPVVYAFIVDINGPSIHPANDNGKELISSLDSPPPAAPSVSASTSAATVASGAPAAGSSAAPSASASTAGVVAPTP